MKVMRELISIKMVMKLLAHNRSGFDSWVGLNSMDRETTDFKIKRTAGGLISLSFCCGGKIVNRVEVPQYVNFTCTRSHIIGSLDKIGREYGLQTELLKWAINHSETTKHNHDELRDVWEPYLKSDDLCLVSVYARHAMEMQKMTQIGIKKP